MKNLSEHKKKVKKVKKVKENQQFVRRIADEICGLDSNT
jgi:hypothetical protein